MWIILRDIFTTASKCELMGKTSPPAAAAASNGPKQRPRSVNNNNSLDRSQQSSVPRRDTPPEIPPRDRHRLSSNSPIRVKGSSSQTSLTLANNGVTKLPQEDGGNIVIMQPASACAISDCDSIRRAGGVIPPAPPGIKPVQLTASKDIECAMHQELKMLEEQEEQHLRRLMHIDTADDCTSLTRLFFQETSLVHGVARAAKVSSDYRRILWMILVLGALCGFTWQTCNLLLDFFNWPVSVVTQMEDSRQLTFPAISICNMNKIKASQLTGTRFESLLELDTYAEEIIPSALSQYLLENNETVNLLVCNPETEWSCPGIHQCIPIEWRCNKNPDCLNGADEENCARCDTMDWEEKCPGVEECVKMYDFCDGIFHCSDGSDETNCESRVCPEVTRDYMFQCNSTKRCIEFGWVKDGLDDCPDGEDEWDETGRRWAEQMANRSMLVRCGDDSYQFTMTFWVCDGHPNCANGFDEMGCEFNVSCKSTQTLCEEGYNCVSDKVKCDDFMDCRNGSDEAPEICPDRINCAEEGLEQCPRSTYCIRPEWRCNGHAECMFSTDEDEDKFSCSTHQCLPHQVKCSDSGYACINATQVCDGFNDCPANVDELNCPGPVECHPEVDGRIACDDGSRCIPQQWICDGQQDCATPVDERNCDVRETCDDVSDKYASCNRWSAKGFCMVSNPHYAFMKTNCRKTCQFCIVPAPNQDTILGNKTDLVTNRDWKIYYDTSQHEDYSDVVDLGMMTKEEIRKLGHKQSEFIIQCTFDGKQCDPEWFSEFQNDMYGNCWTFNDGAKKQADKNISQAGVRHSLQMTIFLDVPNYIGILSHRTGARLSIQDPKIHPFPDELGITLTPGRHTSIGIRQQTLTRQSGRYGDCISEWPSESMTHNAGSYAYSHLACNKMCIQEELRREIGCVDSLLLHNSTLCNIVNSTLKGKLKHVYDRYQHSDFDCQCRQPCDEMVFNKIVSESTWPNNKYIHHMIRRLLKDESHLVRETTKDFLIPYVQAKIDIMLRYKDKSAKDLTFNDTMYKRWFEREMMEMLRMNFLRVEVYFEDLSYEVVTEQPRFGWEHLLSNIGGALGLWLGLSIITVFEFCELIFDLHRIVISSKYKKRQTKRKEMLSQNYRARNAASLKNMQLSSSHI